MPPSARFSFSCDTLHDLDVIEWLNSFANRERGLAIKAAIRQQMQEGEVREGTSPLAVHIDLDKIEGQIADVMRAVRETQRDIAKFDLSKKDDILTDKDTYSKETYTIKPEVEKNLTALFD